MFASNSISTDNLLILLFSFVFNTKQKSTFGQWLKHLETPSETTDNNNTDNNHVSFDFLQFVSTHNLSFYAQIQLINYIRNEVMNKKTDSKTIIESITGNPSVFDAEQYFKPVLDDDSVLMNLHDNNDSDTDSDNGDDRIC